MAQINHSIFFDRIRSGPFPGRLTQSQVDGMTRLLNAWELYGNGDDRGLGYALATDFHETGAKMHPVREGFAATDAKARKIIAHRKYGKPAGPYGHIYYGRGDVQLTWLDNYRRMGEILGIDLVANPDLALDPDVSARILVEGMTRGVSNKGDFTGKSLEDYFNDTVEDPVGARRIVNGTDKAHLIAGYYEEFYEAVKAARQEVEDSAPVEAPATPKRPPANDKMSWGLGLTAGGTALANGKAFLEGIDDPYSLAAFGIAAALAGFGIYLFASGRLKFVRETGE